MTEATNQERNKPRRTLLGKKIGMSQAYSETGEWVPVTVIQAGPCTVLQVKSLPARDGGKSARTAVQLGFDETKKARKRPQQAYLEKIGVRPTRFVKDVPVVDPGAFSPPEGGKGTKKDRTEEESKPADEQGDAPGGLVPGSTVGVALFKDVKRVDIRGVTKGRGFAGVIRRHHFNAGPKSRGTKNIRELGSTGMHTDPGRVHKGKRMPGHMGAVQRKARNLTVVRVEEEENLLVVKGSVPGPNGGYVYIQESLKS